MTYEHNEIDAALAKRITELETQLANARSAARIAGAELRAILAGCGDVEEQMRASIAYQPVIAALAEVVPVAAPRTPRTLRVVRP